MTILLINSNPLVSRLLALCTSDSSFELEEVDELSKINDKHYDIVFVDEQMYTSEFIALSPFLHVDKKVLLTNSKVDIQGFDIRISKPFLPSQITEILYEDSEYKNEIFEETDLKLNESTTSTSKQILDTDTVNEIKDLLKMGDDLMPENDIELLEEQEYEKRKVEAIKEKLIADGLEIVEENEIIDAITPKVKKKNKIAVVKNTAFDKFTLSDKEVKVLEKMILKRIKSMKPKKIKKLLKGKKIFTTLKLKNKKSL